MSPLQKAGGRRALQVLVVFATGYYLSYALRTVNAVVAPELTAELGLSAAELGLMTSAYFLAFAAAQLPLGILLDRYGPVRVESRLLVFAAAGSLLFALAGSTAMLMAARALIGLGVAACLMAAFKAFQQWYPVERQASLSGLVLAAGGLGAMTVSLPLERLLPVIGWRGAVAGLGAGCLLVALLIARLPERPQPRATGGLAEQVGDILRIARSAPFWRYAPHSTFVVGGFMAMQGLWAVPWVMNVTGADRTAAAGCLFAFNLALLSGQLLVAAFATRLLRRGLTASHLLGFGVGLGLLAEGALIAGLLPQRLGWAAYGLCISTGALMYTALTSHFPPELSGRVTTLINLAAFVGAFTLQWGFGLVVDLLVGLGQAPASAYRLTFGALWALQAASFLWFAARGPARKARA